METALQRSAVELHYKGLLVSTDATMVKQGEVVVKPSSALTVPTTVWRFPAESGVLRSTQDAVVDYSTRQQITKES